MSQENVIISFDKVNFAYNPNKPILEEASFSVRQNSKITIMGQNGAGKSTIFKLITKEIKPESGQANVSLGSTIAIATQVMKPENLEKTIEEFFAQLFDKKMYDLPKRIAEVLDIVHLTAPLDKKIKQFSGGQQARLLLAYALIQKPDILLLDEPTNNLDTAGIDHLTAFLMAYPKTCLVISHDANFLNAFTDGVLYLDSFTQKVEQYVGDYYNVLGEIEARIERERAKNAQLRRSIQDRKDKVNFFANKGGKMRALASKLRDQIEEAEENMVDERQEDKTINDFTIPSQPEIIGPMVEIKSVGVMIESVPVHKAISPAITVRKKQRLLIKGPNGIGKSTLLHALASGTEEGAIITPDVRVGYYRQDFSGLDFDKTAYQALEEMMPNPWNQEIYATGAQFLLSSQILKNKVGSLSEGQKGLLCYARFVLQKPGLLIMDEPTNHINFRHLPIIAKALDDFEGAIILVSHVPEFVEQIKIDQVLDLETL
ncbi:MAG: ABC-F family ATP-binding cassette domain-containing protein [Candidatus Magasanikbacteria bacterium]|nr:ABC-F family ATP-binding cassette domain-containing protein [Candidatus Magasanikbacteria bacterium]